MADEEGLLEVLGRIDLSLKAIAGQLESIHLVIKKHQAFVVDREVDRAVRKNR